jgi:hypothetical protein
MAKTLYFFLIDSHKRQAPTVTSFWSASFAFLLVLNSSVPYRRPDGHA